MSFSHAITITQYPSFGIGHIKNRAKQKIKRALVRSHKKDAYIDCWCSHRCEYVIAGEKKLKAIHTHTERRDERRQSDALARSKWICGLKTMASAYFTLTWISRIFLLVLGKVNFPQINSHPITIYYMDLLRSALLSSIIFVVGFVVRLFFLCVCANCLCP